MAGTAYYKIVSKARGSENRYLAMAAWDLADNYNVYVENEVYENDLQLWEKRSTRDGNGFALINKARGLCIRRNGDGNGEMLKLVNVESIERDDQCVWRTEGPYGGYYAINCFADYEQKINISGNGPYHNGMYLVAHDWDGASINELWMTIEAAASIKMTSIAFDLSTANIRDEEPVIAARQTHSNNTDREQTLTLKFETTTVSTYRFEQTNGFSISETIEFSGGIPEIGQMKTAITVQGTYSYKSGEEKGEEEKIAFDFPVVYPPHTTLDSQAILLRARLDVPYTATFEVTYPGQVPFERTAHGVFVNVRSYHVIGHSDEIGKAGDFTRTVLRRI